MENDNAVRKLQIWNYFGDVDHGECVSMLFIVPESRCVFLSSHTLPLFSGGLSLSVVPAPAAVTVDAALRRDEEKNLPLSSRAKKIICEAASTISKPVSLSSSHM